MKAVEKLPEDYRPCLTVDLQNDKKLALLVNAMALVIALVLGVPMHFFVPITTLLDMGQGMSVYMLRIGALLVGMLAYLVLHELVHGITMKLVGTKKVRYGYTGLYAFAGSDDYYDKASYITIALAPVVLWGIVLFVLNLLVDRNWFWVVYFIQLMNLSGAAGDYYVTAKFMRLPKSILVRDVGVSMTVYAKTGDATHDGL